MSAAKPNSIEVWGIDKIKPYEMNAKIHDDKQVKGIAESIKRLGWKGNPIIVDEEGVILAGHGRRLAAISLGMKEVPVICVKDMTEDEKKAFRLADNRVAISNIDTDILQKELAAMSFDLDGIFDKKELDFLEADLGTMNVDAFVDDLDVEVKKQSDETSQKIEEADAKSVKLEKAMGFKEISGKDERVVVRFMAQIESETGLTGADAFVGFVKSLQEAV
jgi:hypothetical protein